MTTALASESPVGRVVRVLGGRAVLHRVVTRPDQVIALVRAGIPVRALERMAHVLGAPLNRIAALVGISGRTLARRRREREGRLDVAASDRLLRLAQVLARAEDVLGAEEKAVRWLCAPNRALDGAAPLDLMDTDFGTRSVEAVLGRIEHGLVS